jgi:hypothetical protein
MLSLTTRMVPPDRGSIVRRTVLTVSAVLAVIGMYWITRSFSIDGKLRFGNPVAAPSDAAHDVEPRQIRAEVTRVQGNPVVRAGDRCEFLVERRVSATFECNAQVVCGGRLLYGGRDRGYFPCKLFEDERPNVVGSDPNTTSNDQDAAIHLNTRDGVMRIWDDEQGTLGKFDVEAEVLSVH